MDNKKLVSIIIPIYNTEKYLKKCIESIINQTYRYLEIILVNDGSTDESLKICQTFAENDNRISIIDKSNGGISDARNYGIDVATGEYIVFVDSDDFIHPEMIEILYNAINLKEADVAICSYKCVKDNEAFEQEKGYDALSNLKTMSNEEALHELFGDNMVMYTVAWNKMYRSKLFYSIRYPKGKIHEDEYITYKLLYSSNVVVYVNQNLYYYLQRADSTMGKGLSKKNYDKVLAFKQRADFMILKDVCVKEAINSYFWVLQAYIQWYKKEFPNQHKEVKSLKRQYKENCKKYKKYLTHMDYFKLYFKYYFPQMYQLGKKALCK